MLLFASICCRKYWSLLLQNEFSLYLFLLSGPYSLYVWYCKFSLWGELCSATLRFLSAEFFSHFKQHCAVPIVNKKNKNNLFVLLYTFSYTQNRYLEAWRPEQVLNYGLVISFPRGLQHGKLTEELQRSFTYLCDHQKPMKHLNLQTHSLVAR